MYYEIASVREDWPYGTSPGSLSSNGYNGHMFWDQETWMYPMFLMLHESTFETYAASLLQYRFDRLQGAIQNANQTGYANCARYPWESAFSGLEVCPTTANTGEYEIHINIDIQLAIKQYYLITKNDTWLESVGFPMLYEISKYLVTRGFYNLNTSSFEWLNDMGPDEYWAPINNSAYFNSGALQMLNFTIEAAQILGKNDVIPYYWQDVVKTAYIPFNDTGRWHPEFDGYNTDLKVKQADVILMQFPWEYPMSDDVKYNDLKIYEAVTDPSGPAMTWSMFAVNWLALNETEKAASLFEESYVNIQSPFKIWTETADGGGTVNFITGGGGWLQAFIFGFGGIRVNSMDHVEINYLGYLGSMQRMRLSGVNYLGNEMEIEYANSNDGQYFKPGHNMAFVVTYYSDANAPLQIVYNNGSRLNLTLLDRVFISEHSFPVKVCAYEA